MEWERRQSSPHIPDDFATEKRNAIALAVERDHRHEHRHGEKTVVGTADTLAHHAHTPAGHARASEPLPQDRKHHKVVPVPPAGSSPHNRSWMGFGGLLL